MSDETPSAVVVEEGNKRNIILGYERVSKIEEAITAIRMMVAGMASQLDAITSRQHSQSRELDKLETRITAIEMARAVEHGSELSQAKALSVAWVVGSTIVGSLISGAGVFAMIKGLK